MDVQYKVYQFLQSHTIQSFANIYYLVTSFDPIYGYRQAVIQYSTFDVLTSMT